MTVSRHNQWSWGGHADSVKSSVQCLEMLTRCAGGDGNMLLDVGPMPNGEIAPEQVGVIKEMGTWLAKNGESIYGTRGGPFEPFTFGVSTHKGNTIYLHILNRLGDTLELPSIPAKVIRSKALTGGKVTVTQGDDRISISLPKSGAQMLDMIITLELDRPTSEIGPIKVHLP
jgi:alpha-L-fucosidase